MKKIVFVISILFSHHILQAQKKPSAQKPSSPQINKMMKEAMRKSGMSGKEQSEINEIMTMAAGMKNSEMPFSAYPHVDNNAALLPAKKNTVISAIGKPPQSDAEVSAKAAFIFNRMIAKAPAEEKKIIDQTLAKLSGAGDLESVAVASLLKGHAVAALALAAHAVQTEPSALVYQNNLAAILTQTGYAEQAIPLLQKLEKQFPRNSTILTNMAYAWFYLGDKENSKTYTGRALARNPSQAAASVCAGIIDEINGDPIKSATELENGYNNSLDGFSANLIKNNSGKEAGGKLTFDKIKDKISIYEYIKDDWIKSLPNYSYVCGEEQLKNNEELRMGYADMIQHLYQYLKIWSDTIENNEKRLAQQIGNETTADKLKYIQERPGLLTKQVLLNAKGIYNIIQQETMKMFNEWDKETFAELNQKMDDHQGTGPGPLKEGEDGCEKSYKFECDFLLDYNNEFRTLAVKKLEQFRLVINAGLTWSWYVNFYDTENMMVAHQFQDIFTPFVDLLRETAEEFVLQPNPCNFGPFTPVARPTAQPPLPLLECPIVVSIPTGMNFTELAGARGAGNNSAVNIKPSSTNPVPNVQIGMGLDKSSPSEPGDKNTPYVQTSNGDAQAMNIQNEDPDELAPLANIKKGDDPDELAPLANIKKGDDPDELAPLANIKKGDDPDELAPLANIKGKDEDELAPLLDVKGMALKKLLHDLMSDCKGLHKYTPKEIRDMIRNQAKSLQQVQENKRGDILKRLNEKQRAQQARSPNSNTQQLDNVINKLQSQQNALHNMDLKSIGNDGVVPTIVNNMQADIHPVIPGLFN